MRSRACTLYALRNVYTLMCRWYKSPPPDPTRYRENTLYTIVYLYVSVSDERPRARISVSLSHAPNGSILYPGAARVHKHFSTTYRTTQSNTRIAAAYLIPHPPAPPLAPEIARAQTAESHLCHADSSDRRANARHPWEFRQCSNTDTTQSHARMLACSAQTWSCVLLHRTNQAIFREHFRRATCLL